MERLRLGASEIEVTRILMGTWQAGKAMWADIDDGLFPLPVAFEEDLVAIEKF